MIEYVIHSILLFGAVYLIYVFVLRREKSLIFNRFFLLSSLILCTIGPELKIDVGFDLLDYGWTPAIPSTEIIMEEHNRFQSEVAVQDYYSSEITGNQAMDFVGLVRWIYGAVTLLLLVRFFNNLFRILIKIKYKKIRKYQHIWLIVDKEAEPPYSFFNFLFIPETENGGMYLSDEVVLHESIHSKQFHSIDILFVEILICFLWFNPFIWFYRKLIAENHEFLADQGVLESGKSIEEYTKLLINYINQNCSNPLSSGFGFTFTKTRLSMLFQTKKSKINYVLKSGLALFLFFIAIGISSFTTQNNSAKNPFVVMIDAGHGGEDAGYSVNGLSEKEINLQIADKLASWSKNKHVEIILVRETDEFISLKDRVEKAKKDQVDVFLTLHGNASVDPSESGVRIYFSSENELAEQSKMYAEYLLSSYTAKGGEESGKLGLANFYTIKNNSVPALVLEMGYFTNKTDWENMTNPTKQKEYASHLYQALVEMSDLKQNE